MRNQPNRKVRVASLTQAKLHFPLPTLGAYFAEFDFGRRSTHDRERFVPREEARRADICSGEYRSYRADSSFPFRSELLSSFGSHVLLAIKAAELARHAHRADSSFPCRSELLIEGSVEGVILVVRSCHMVSLRFVWVLLAVYAILIDLPRLQ